MKITPIALALCLSAVPVASAIAADPPLTTQQTITLKFKAVINQRAFSITPAKKLPTDLEETLFEYDDIRQTFTTYTNQFTVKSDGKVKAKLEKSAALTGPGKPPASIPLDVTLGGKPVLPAGLEVHAGGATPTVLDFVISPKGGSYTVGTYTGNVVLIFDVG